MSRPNITVVTGGSSGIGAACVRHLAKRGDHVISLDLPGTWSEEKMRTMGVTA
jgi:NAD(P)-dependent dehydrogenase (short-subunit alcohol dehydrogenase family)